MHHLYNIYIFSLILVSQAGYIALFVNYVQRYKEFSLAVDGWKLKGRDPGLERENIPVQYVVLSEHLDRVGVKLCADYRDSRALNGEDLQERIHRIIGPWKGGKFMPLSQRSHSLNT